MATKKPRMMLTLDPQTFATFKHYALLSERPVSSIVAELLTQCRPEFEKLGAMLQQARQLQSRSKQEQDAFLEKLDLMAGRAHLADHLIQTDLELTLRAAPRTVAAPAATAVGRGKKASKKAPQSLIHRNKVPNPLPTRVPAVSVPKKRGAKRETT